MALPGETEAGSAGKQPCRGIARRAHRDDDRGRGSHLSRSTQNPIGSKDPDALKIPARRAASTLARNAPSPVPAEPAQFPATGRSTSPVKRARSTLSRQARASNCLQATSWASQYYLLRRSRTVPCISAPAARSSQSDSLSEQPESKPPRARTQVHGALHVPKRASEQQYLHLKRK